MGELLWEVFSGVLYFGTVDGIKTLVMFLIAGILIYLAIAKDYEPALLLPIGFGAILANLPPAAEGVAAVIGTELSPGFLKVLYSGGIANELFPILIFIAIGAMIDFTPLLKNPVMIFFGAAAQFGIFATFLITLALLPLMGITGADAMHLASAIGIIGAADGPTTLYVANWFNLTEYIGPISVAAYSYMSLVPIIQPPVIRALTTKAERRIRMDYSEEKVSRVILIIFPIAITIIAGIIVPMSA
ncbi:MAG: sodium ion-translocating decarboxylase subunit beta, partial [Ruminococcaceae bacterium]|nr:sodium ion-translocating decarboxylase subunit beta [Oscillospiraceae bacterium]